MRAVQADNSARWIVRRAAKAAVASALCAAGARWAVRTIARRIAGGPRVLILSYHRPTVDFAGQARATLPSMLVSIDTLRQQLQHLAREREIVSLDDACRLLAGPPRLVSSRDRTPDVAVLTFDDGYVDVYREALPVLRELRVPATVYVPTGFVGTRRRLVHDRLFAALAALEGRQLRPRAAGLPPEVQPLLDACAQDNRADTLNTLIDRLSHEELDAVTSALEKRLGLDETELPESTRIMTWDELRALRAGGVHVGGHTVNHASLANLPRARALAEVRGCRDDIEANVGEAPRHFAYPNGYYTPATRKVVEDCGFVSAVTTEDLENRCGGDPFVLKRKTIWENSTLGATRFSAAVASVYLDNVFGVLGWRKAHSGARPDSEEAVAPPAAEGRAEAEAPSGGAPEASAPREPARAAG